MMGKASRDKGKRGEREAAAALMEALPGVQARRGVQYAGGTGSPDVVHTIPGIHLEAKRCERLSLWKALEQAQQDAGDLAPIVMHRANHKPWVVIIPLDQLLRVVHAIDAAT